MSDTINTEGPTRNEGTHPLPTNMTDDTAEVEVSAPTLSDAEGSKEFSDSAEMAEMVVTSSKYPATTSKGTAPVSHIDVETSPRLRSLQQIRRLEENFDKGYDSDGECGPFITMQDVEGEQIFDESELGERASEKLGTKDGATVVTNDDDADEDISNEVEGGDIDHTDSDIP